MSISAKKHLIVAHITKKKKTRFKGDCNSTHSWTEVYTGFSCTGNVTITYYPTNVCYNATVAQGLVAFCNYGVITTSTTATNTTKPMTTSPANGSSLSVACSAVLFALVFLIIQ